MNYGLPYMGSKNKIAEWVLSYLPKADNLYDLFCGGSAITHCAMAKNRYKNYYINDIEPTLPQAFLDAVNGKFKDENRWISREDFFRLKDTDAYVRICFSFGSNEKKGYAYSQSIEPTKKAFHNAIYFNDFSGMPILEPIRDIVGIRNRYLAAKKILKGIIGRFNLQNLERTNRIQSLEATNRIQSLEATNLSYDKVEIKPNSVIYCDIPYKNTGTYNKERFDYEKFYDWCEKQTQPLFISEYWMPEDRFVCIAKKSKTTSMAKYSPKATVEKIFIPKHHETTERTRAYTLFG